MCEPLASPGPATLCPSYPQCFCALVHIHPYICPWKGGGVPLLHYRGRKEAPRGK